MKKLFVHFSFLTCCFLAITATGQKNPEQLKIILQQKIDSVRQAINIPARAFLNCFFANEVSRFLDR